jgi:hypothetical protein
MTRREFEDEDSDELTASEVRQFASLPRTRPASLANEDRLIALLTERGVLARSPRITRWSPFARAAAVVVIFGAGTLMGYSLRQPGRPRIEDEASVTSRLSPLQAPAIAESPIQPASDVSNTTRHLIWF